MTLPKFKISRWLHLENLFKVGWHNLPKKKKTQDKVYQFNPRFSCTNYGSESHKFEVWWQGAHHSTKRQMANISSHSHLKKGRPPKKNTKAFFLKPAMFFGGSRVWSKPLVTTSFKGWYEQKQSCHQEFQVPKMESLNLIRLFWGWVFP